MKGTSKLIMGATLVMVVSLAVVLGLILVLLAELYCSLLLRRRQLRNSSSSATHTATIRTNASPSRTSNPREQSPPPPFSSIYAQGVIQAPRSFFFPGVVCKEDVTEAKKQLSDLHQVIQTQHQESNTSPRHIGLLSASSPPTSFISKTPPKPIQENPLQGSTSGTIFADKSSSGEHLVYISNPIYENDDSKPSGANTPFETPQTSPSHLERSGSSGEDEAAKASPSATHSPPYTPPLTPIKKLPAEACSVSLRDARSLGTSGSDSRSNNGLSSSSSGSPCTSPSW